MKGLILGATVLACYGFLAKAYNVPLSYISRGTDKIKGPSHDIAKSLENRARGGERFRTAQKGLSSTGIPIIDSHLGRLPLFPASTIQPALPLPFPTTGFTQSHQNSFSNTGFFSNGIQNSFLNQGHGNQIGGHQGASFPQGGFSTGQQGVISNGVQGGTSGGFQGSQTIGTQGTNHFGANGGSVGIGNQGGHFPFPQSLPTGQGGSFYTVKTEYFSANQSSSGNQGVSQSGFQSGSAGGIHKTSYGGAVLGGVKKPGPVQGGQVYLGSQQAQGSHGIVLGGNLSQANVGTQQTHGVTLNQGQVTHSVVSTVTSSGNYFNNAQDNSGVNTHGLIGSGGVGNSPTQGGYSAGVQSGVTNVGQQSSVTSNPQGSFTGVGQAGNSFGSHVNEVQGAQGIATNAHQGTASNSGAQGSSFTQLPGSSGGNIHGSQDYGGIVLNQAQGGTTTGVPQNTVKVVQESSTGGAQTGELFGSHSNQAQGGQGLGPIVHQSSTFNSGAQEASPTQLQSTPVDHNQNTLVNVGQSHTSQQGNAGSSDSLVNQETHTGPSTIQQGESINHGQNVSPGTNFNQNQGNLVGGLKGDAPQQQDGSFHVVQDTIKVIQEAPSHNHQAEPLGSSHGGQADVAYGGNEGANDAPIGGHTGPSANTQPQPADDSQHVDTDGHQKIIQIHNNAQSGVPAGPSLNAQPQPADDSQQILSGHHGNSEVHNSVHGGGYASPSLTDQPQHADSSHQVITGGQESTPAHNNAQNGLHAAPAAEVQPQAHDVSQHANNEYQADSAHGVGQGSSTNQGHESLPSGSLSGDASVPQNSDSSPIVHESTATIVGESLPTTNHHGEISSGSNAVHESIATVVNESSGSNHQDVNSPFASDTVHESTATVIGGESPSPKNQHNLNSENKEVLNHDSAGQSHGNSAFSSDTVQISTATAVGEETPSLKKQHNLNSENKEVLTHDSVGQSQQGLNTEHENHGIPHHSQHSQDSTPDGHQESHTDLIRGSSANGGHSVPVNPAQGIFSSGDHKGTIDTVQESITTAELSHGSPSVPVDAAHNGQVPIDQGDSANQFQGSTAQSLQETKGHNAVGFSTSGPEGDSDNLQDTTYGATGESIGNTHGGSYGQEQGGSFKTVQENTHKIAQQGSTNGDIPLQSAPGVHIHSPAQGTSQIGFSDNRATENVGNSIKSSFHRGSQGNSFSHSAGTPGQTQGGSFSGPQGIFSSEVTSGSTSGFQSFSTIQQKSTITGGLLGAQGSSFTISQAGPNGSLQTCQCTCQDANNPIFSKYAQGSAGHSYAPSKTEKSS